MSTSFHHLVSERRSVRAYAAKPVERAKIERCLDAARLAPSACNAQPWSFVVVDEPALKERVAACASGGALPLNHFTRQAPVLVVVIMEPANLTSRFGSTVKRKHFPLVDIGMAAEHFCLQAVEEGLGTCVLGWFDEAGVRALLDLPARSRPVLLLTVGYAEATPSPKPRKTLDEIRAWNTYPGRSSAPPRSLKRSLLGLLCWMGVTLLAAAVGGAASAGSGSFYRQLARPEWAPPGWVFGPVWSLLYTLMGLAAWRVWRNAGVGGARTALTLYLVQLGCNALWTWLFFAWRLGAAAFFEILVLVALVGWTARAFGKISRLAAWLMAPYLAWLAFAAVLAYALWRMNPALL